MGAIHVDATIRNPADRSRSWRGRFLVDGRAMNTVVPPECMAAVGLSPWGRRTHLLPDGRRADLEVAGAVIEFMNDFVGGTIVVGEAGSEPVLGFTALQSMGMEVDVENHELRKLPAIRLKAVAQRPRLVARSACLQPTG